MQLVEKAIQDTTDAIRSHHAIDWNQMLDLIHLTGMEKSMKNQYQNASNISSRINLHSLYSQNKQGWFPWVYEQCQIHPGMRILELGCGDGVLWTQNISSLPGKVSVTLSDLSSGMLRDARRAIGRKDSRFSFEAFDCARIPHEDRSFDLVIANHVLFYCEDISAVCSEIQRVLTPGGKLICSTYGKNTCRKSADWSGILTTGSFSPQTNSMSVLAEKTEQISWHRIFPVFSGKAIRTLFLSPMQNR